MRTIGLAAVLALAGGQAGAETITFEADGGAVFTRCSSLPVPTTCEVIFPPGTRTDAFVCVAIGADQNPLGAVAGPGLLGPTSVWFPELPADQIATVRCRRR